MKITVLGCNGLYPTNAINTSGYLLQTNGKAILLDVGSGVFNQLKDFVLPEKIDVIFLSHLHFDHVSDIGVYNYYLEAKARKGEFNGKIKLFVKNDESAVYRAIEQLNYFEICEYNEGEERKIGDLSLNFFKRPHPVLTHGLLVRNNEKTFVYASDGAMDEKFENAIKEAQVSLCHTPFTFEKAAQNKAHASAFEVVKLASEHGKRVILSHLLPDTDNGELLKEIADFDCFEIAKQGRDYQV